MIEKKYVNILLALAAAYFIVRIVMQMPQFESPEAPAYINTIPRYLEKSAEDTGAVNIVASIILDYRAYDTLGEATVLFTAIIAILSLMGVRKGEK